MIERIAPADRDAWLAVRGKDITASVVGALFDAHEFVTLYELWALKSGQLRRSSAETPAMRRGRLLEPVAVQLLREQRPDWKITHNAAENIYLRDPEARLGATPDVLAEAPGRGLGAIQIKSVEASVYRRKWLDDAGEPEAPLWIALQATLEAHLTGARWAAVAPLVVGHGLDMPLIEVPLVDGVIETITERAAEFWRMVEDGRAPEPDYARDGVVIDQLYARGDAEDEADLTNDNRIPALLAERAEALAARRAAEDRLAAIDAEVKAKMGAAEVAHIGQGRKITWTTQRRSGFHVPPKTVRSLRYPSTPPE